MIDLTGKQVKILHYSLGKDRKTYILREIEEGTVTDCYKHIFRVKINNHHDCFRYHEITGNERTKVVLK